MDELGMRVLFHGVAQRPGRPLKFGIMAERPVFWIAGKSSLYDGVLLSICEACAEEDGWTLESWGCRV